jgi:hypothetical protein
MAKQILKKLPQERWTNERINQVPYGINLQSIGIMDLKEMFGGWNSFVEQFPGSVHKYATNMITPYLAREFLNKYGQSQDLRFMKMNLDLRRKYGGFFQRKPLSQGQERPQRLVLGFYGSTKTEYYENGGLSFRGSNQWDNQVRDFENTRTI